MTEPLATELRCRGTRKDLFLKKGLNKVSLESGCRVRLRETAITGYNVSYPMYKKQYFTWSLDNHPLTKFTSSEIEDAFKTTTGFKFAQLTLSDILQNILAKRQANNFNAMIIVALVFSIIAIILAIRPWNLLRHWMAKASQDIRTEPETLQKV